ncbi:MAG: hypothetical protein GY869_07785, partial [Planctomycetes bacterium]|nr:hypothetical protein [Planctomycetota bacterium]
MKIAVTAKAVAQLSGSALIALVFEKARRLPVELRGLPAATASTIQNAFETDDFEGKSGQILTLYTSPGEPYKRVILIGLGERRKFDAEAVRKALGTAVQTLAKLKVD